MASLPYVGLGLSTNLDPNIPPDPFRLLEALPTIVASDLRNVPVVNSRKEMRLIGAIVRAAALGVVAEASDGSGN